MQRARFTDTIEKEKQNNAKQRGKSYNNQICGSCGTDANNPTVHHFAADGFAADPGFLHILP